MKKKSDAFYRYCQDIADDKLDYYDPEEIEDAVYDLIDVAMMDDAQKLAEHGLKLHPGNENVESLVIWIYMHNHQTEKAESMFQKYKGSDSDWAIRLRFSMEVLHGHPRQALDMFLKRLLDGSVAPADWVNTIEEMFDAIPNDVLAPALIKATEFTGKDAETLGRLGSLLIDTGQIAEAANALERSLDQNAYDTYSWQDLARCYLLLGNNEKCIEACDFGLAIEDQNPLLCFIKGYVLFQNLEHEACIPYLLCARKFAEGKISAKNLNLSDNEIQEQINITYEMLGLSFLETDQYPEAKECFEILLERNPNNTKALSHMANMLMLEGDQNQALEYIRRAVDLNPLDEGTQSLQISILMNMQKYQEAIDVLKKLIEMFPTHSSYLMAYAELQLQDGDKKEADKAYRKLLKMKVSENSYQVLLRNYFTLIGDDDALKELGEAGLEQ